VDFSSTYCFVDSCFIYEHIFSTFSTLLVELQLFDETSNNIIFEVISMPITFFPVNA